MTGFRRGIRLGIDVGKARVGVARCDPDGMLAVPVETVPRSEASVDRIAELAAEWEPIEFVVGLPVNLRGDETPSTADARDFAVALGVRTGIDVRLVDERLSTVSAHAALRSSGRSQKKSRSIVDQVAAVVLLQHAVDTEKSTGTPAGALIDLDEEPTADV
ncbi:Holliday junction resolvase RuvX [Microbacterium sp.]|uniref:Holliday junction resolvase RuvX n=1 Tax=Microbacterium sp. TaxID=51671 RepID=UPI00281212BE|nr:Holliday junction resolvase RuvX [Microbacterium sp.]